MRQQEESEGSLYYTTTYTYELDFVQDELSAFSSWIRIPKIVLTIVANSFKTVVMNFFKISWESVLFNVLYIQFLQKKAVRFIYLLENSKDLIVALLMWRRGFLFRPTTQVGLVALVILALMVGSLFHKSLSPQDFTRGNVLAAENTPVTLVPEDRPRSDMTSYKVENGDNLSKIASVYSVSVDTIKWANDMGERDDLKPGEKLLIPPVSGVVHKVKSGESLSALAKKYKADAQTIATYPYNYLDDSLKLRVGETLYIPGGKMPEPEPIAPSYNSPAPASYYVAGGSGLFAWPVKGSLNQSPSWWHPALDLGAPIGTPITAAAQGTVTAAGWSAYGYGNHVIIKHPNGYSTLYAHLNNVSVSSGQNVSTGSSLGTVGCTGFCTGPHLHFEILLGKDHVNPLSVLP